MERLFVYGSLGEMALQKTVIGRTLQGTPAVLEGYRRARLLIDGESYPVIVREPESIIRGLLIAVTLHELELFDAYETRAYRRRKLTLKNGVQAWVYLKR